MKKKTLKLNFDKSTIAQLNNVDKNAINGGALESRPFYASCPVVCPISEACSLTEC
ncbi:MAG: class I lanthipeptide [Hyphomicrobiales bacterium]